MKKSDIKLGACYWANVSGNRVKVRVERINDTGPGRSYTVTNLSTGRTCTFRSAQRFLSEFKAEPLGIGGLKGVKIGEVDLSMGPTVADLEQEEGEQGPDPSIAAPAAVAVVRSAAPELTTDSLADALATLNRPSRPAEPHLVVEALAGTGKTTTLVAGLQILKGMRPTNARGDTIVPSAQQDAVWEELRRTSPTASVCFVAFNRSIAAELKGRVPPGCDAMTMHGLGFRAVTKALGRQEPNDWVVQDTVAELLGRDLRELKRERIALVSGVERLVGLCKQNLVGLGWSEGGDKWAEELEQLVSHYDVDLDGCRDEAFDLVPRVLERCKEPRGKISFDDMIWLPVVLGLPVPRHDLLLVDEAQDLNRCQQALARKAGHRLVLVGDRHQAIYGFAGADADSIPRMIRELGETDSIRSGRCPSPDFKGCTVLPLTVTRRCGRRIVEEARRYVPEFEAHSSNPEGLVSRTPWPFDKDGKDRPQHYRGCVKDGDMVLCRVNAPLVSECFRFIRAGRKANIQGRDVGRGLASTTVKLAGGEGRVIPVAQFVGKLGDWLEGEQKKEEAKRNLSETRLRGLQDRHDCLLCFTEGAADTEDVLRRIGEVFTDDKDRPGIRLSSIHKAKGLEADRVFFLQPPGVGPRDDKMREWERQQERNLRYVAITRAIEELVYVS